MVTFDGKEYKPSLCSKLKAWFAKWFSRKPKSVLKTPLVDAIDPEKCVIELDTRIVKDAELTTMAKLREEFLIKKYHLIGSHNAMISAMNDDVNNFKHFAENCVNMKSQFKILSNFFELIKTGPTKEWIENPGLGTQKMNDAIKALDLLIRCNNDIEKSYNTYIKKLQAKILNRSVLIGDLTRAENLEEIKEAEKNYKSRSKQKINKEK